ncbi:MAG TPA: hypothetical protein VJ964_12535 [Balneolaceae bacterium]|nr:hypothetical protein [Balneolaceae bacterium]
MSILGFSSLGKGVQGLPPILLFGIPQKVQTRWTSLKNQRGLEEEGAKENDGAKRHAFD